MPSDCATPPLPPADGGQVRLLPLAAGETAYRLDGPVNGRRLLLVHGATVPLWQYDAVVPRLAAAGFRTLRFDLLGHGDSARPAGRYPLGCLVAQAEELLVACGWGGSLSLLGHSLGAAVAAALAIRLGARVDRLVMTAPLLDFTASNPVLHVMRWPALGAAFMRLHGMRALRRRRRRRFEAIGLPELVARFEAQVARPGFREALVALARDGALGPHHEIYRRLGALGRPVRILWGTADRVVPEAHAATVAHLVGGELVALAGLEHNLLLAAPHRVVEAVVGFLRPRAGAPSP